MLGLLVGRGYMGISGRVFDWRPICVGSSGLKSQQGGAGWGFTFAGWGRVGRIDRDPLAPLVPPASRAVAAE
jgi:hypothetical protein